MCSPRTEILPAASYHERDPTAPTQETKTISLQSNHSESHTVNTGTGPVNVPMTTCTAYGKKIPTSDSMPQGIRPKVEHDDQISRLPNVHIRPKQLKINRTPPPDANNTALPPTSPAGISLPPDTELDHSIAILSFESGRISSDGADSGKPTSDDETDVTMEDQTPVKVPTRDMTKHLRTNTLPQDPENATVSKFYTETPV